MEAGLEATGDDNLGLHLCGCVGPESAPLGLLLMACPNLLTGIPRLLFFERLVTDVRRMSLHTDDQGTWLELRLPEPERPAARHVAEWLLGDAQILSERILGRRLRPLAVQFAHMGPAGVHELEAWFDAPVTFAKETHRILLSETDWRAPLRTASPFFASIFEKQVQSDLEAYPEQTTLEDAIDAFVRAGLPDLPTARDVATHLQLSVRTLQRSLQVRGTSLSAIADQVRRDEAEQRVMAGTPMDEVADQLGYATTTAFFRAFRRWFGTPPAQWRAMKRHQS